MSKCSGLKWMGNQEGKGERDRESEGGVVIRRHPWLMSREAENHR